MAKRIKPTYRKKCYSPDGYTNEQLIQLVLSRLPIQDNPKTVIIIQGHFPKPTVRGNMVQPYIDVTRQVKQLLKQKKIKRIRRYGYGHSGKAGHTYFVAND